MPPHRISLCPIKGFLFYSLIIYHSWIIHVSRCLSVRLSCLILYENYFPFLLLAEVAENGLSLILEETNRLKKITSMFCFSTQEPSRRHNFQERITVRSFSISLISPVIHFKEKKASLKINYLLSVCPKADKNIPNSTKVSVEVTPPMNGVADVDEVWPSLHNHAYIFCMCAHSARLIPDIFPKILEEEEEDEDQPLSLAWPDTIRKQITYLLILPIVFPLWLTLPDVRREVTTHTLRTLTQCLRRFAGTIKQKDRTVGRWNRQFQTNLF